MSTDTAVPTTQTAADPTEDPHAARRAEDAELFARLQAREFTGPEANMLRDRLFLYGWRVLHRWMRDGEIIVKCRENRVFFAAPYTEVEELMRRYDVRQDIAVSAMTRALPRFMAVVLKTWDPEGGRALNTYFLHFALWAFRDAYRQWAKVYRAQMYEILGSAQRNAPEGEEWDPWSPEPDPEYQTVLEETLATILADASVEERAVCAAMLAGATQEEIAVQLGTTRKAVERRLARVRGRAKALAAAGDILVPSVSSAVTR
ncbi:ECF-type sigma factor [Streptomyces sp. NPDC101115]|uniref:ECF-type sigma factor n=1 Tax=Streptomyces sp. NPDC101115 TaxID=3366106 RepID=UPI0037F25349